MIRLPIYTEKYETFSDPETCTSCGGECCKRYPPLALPGEFADFNEIEAKIRSGLWTFDCWDGDLPGSNQNLRRILMVRPSVAGSEGYVLDRLYEGQCTFLGTSGCTLPRDDRPMACLVVKPSRDPGCPTSLDKQEVARHWRPLVEQTEALLEKLIEDGWGINSSRSPGRLLDLLLSLGLGDVI